MVADEPSLMESAGRLRPALAVVDVTIAEGNVGGMMRRLRESCEGLKVIVVSAYSEPELAESLLDAGADGFVVKSAAAVQLLPAVDAVIRRERYRPSPRNGADVGDT